VPARRRRDDRELIRADEEPDMTDDSARSKDVVSRFYEDVFIRHDMSRLDEYMRDDYTQHNQDCPQGKAGFVEFFDTIFRAVPDFSYTLKKMVAEGDVVMAFSTTTGTHTGDAWLGKQATGNPAFRSKLTS
jgi:predicted SnoaL-like aldol condensation-catalyzing enzyme